MSLVILFDQTEYQNILLLFKFIIIKFLHVIVA